MWCARWKWEGEKKQVVGNGSMAIGILVARHAVVRAVKRKMQRTAAT